MKEFKLGSRKSPWDSKRLKYSVRSPTYEEALKIVEQYPEWDAIAYFTNVYDQGDVGTCAGFSAKNIKHALEQLQNNREVEFSAAYLYYWSRKKYADPPIPEDEEGTYPLSVLKVLLHEGAAPLDCAPEDVKSPFVYSEATDVAKVAEQYKIASYHWVPNDRDSMKAAMLGITFEQPYKMPDGSPGCAPLYVGIPVYKSFMTAQTNGGIVPMPQVGEQLLGGHAIVIRGWKLIAGVEHWIVVNSWGNTGDNGIYYYPVGAPVDEAWMIVEGPPSPGPDPEHEDPKPVDPPTPSTCVWGNASAKILSLVPWLLRRRGRMYYMNPADKN